MKLDSKEDAKIDSMQDELNQTKSNNLQTFFLQNKKKMILVVAVIIGFLLIVIVFLTKTKEQSKPFIDGPLIGSVDKNQKNIPQQYNNSLYLLPKCSNSQEIFSIFPVKKSDFSSITPLGNLNPSGHTFPTDHLYVEIFDPQNFQPNNQNGGKSLIAPADVWVIGIQLSEQIGGITDYAVDFSPCQEVKGKFGHVGTLSQKIQTEINKLKTRCNEYETGGNKYRNCEYSNLKIQIKAGEELGTAGNGRSAMLDIWMSDYREPQIKRANQNRWSPERNNVSCFLNYFPPQQKEQYYNLLRGPNGGKRTKEPRCGTVEVDIAETAQGVWFYNLQGNVQQEDPHLALVFDNIETDQQVFSVGTTGIDAGIPSGTYNFIPKTDGEVNRDFSQVRADGRIYCYNTQNYSGERKSILLKMPTALKLQIKNLPYDNCGVGPWQITEDFVEYER